MHWIYLSPHFDDAVLSCGGMIWEQVHAGEQVEIWTICAGELPADLPEFAQHKHHEWRVAGDVVAQRRAEDRAACALVGAEVRYASLPDCIYRRLPSGEALIQRNDDLWLPLHPGELGLQRQLSAWLAQSLPAQSALVCPLTLGNHVDHRLVRAAAEALGRPLYYYPDYPYIARMGGLLPTGLPEAELLRVPVSQAGVTAWRAGVAAYASQVDDLFGSLAGMHTALEQYWQSGGGSFLWRG
ncbi:MAG: PIG-L family deacetylase [Anaerolineae bacterium]|nr:PIG-L family deacetylase [Anaerolineae bacterium]